MKNYNEKYNNNIIGSNIDLENSNLKFVNEHKDSISSFGSIKKEFNQDKSNINNRTDINNLDNECKSFFNNTNKFDNNFNNYYCFHIPLTDDQKKNLQPRDSTFIDKLVDFLFNW